MRLISELHDSFGEAFCRNQSQFGVFAFLEELFAAPDNERMDREIEYVDRVLLQQSLSEKNMAPLYRFHKWQANLRVLGLTEIKTVPNVPLSRPFIERLIGTISCECLNRILFWTAAYLEVKLSNFKSYYSRHGAHASLEGQTPIETPESKSVNFKSYRWQKHCRGLYQTPMAA